MDKRLLAVTNKRELENTVGRTIKKVEHISEREFRLTFEDETKLEIVAGILYYQALLDSAPEDLFEMPA